jgi:hypothetical protein
MVLFLYFFNVKTLLLNYFFKYTQKKFICKILMINCKTKIKINNFQLLQQIY